MRAILAAILALTTLVLLPASAFAQGKSECTTKKQCLQHARRLHNQGKLAYDRGDYEEAIVKWKRAYELSEKPEMLANLSQAHEKLGELKTARVYLAKWRRHAPASKHSTLDKKLDALDQRIAQQDDQARKDELKRKQQEKEAAALKAEKERLRKEAEKRNQAQQAADQRAAEQRRNNIIGWTLTGVGAAAVIAGIIVDAVAASSRPDTDEACKSGQMGTLCPAELRDDIETANTMAIAGDITWISGSVLTATGVVLLLVLDTGGEPGPESMDSTFVPLVGPQHAGLLFRQRF